MRYAYYALFWTHNYALCVKLMRDASCVMRNFRFWYAHSPDADHDAIIILAISFVFAEIFSREI